jgi:D-glycero-alpha-D-manno-heptose-7-phosphate kinase
VFSTSRTPLRISLFGGGTDYPSYFRENRGAVVGSTINKYVYIVALPLSSFAEQRYRISYRTTESVQRIEDIAHPVIRTCLLHYGYKDPLNIATMSDFPGGTGLGSSSAFTVGFLNLLFGLQSRRMTNYELARQAIQVEHDLLNENVGIQDQLHATFGGLARYEFQGEQFSIHPLRVSSSRYERLSLSLLLVFTGRTRHASAVLEDQEERTKSGRNSENLLRMYEMALEGSSILEESGNDDECLRRLGKLLNESWKLKRQLSAHISDSAIDSLYDQGMRLGAWGGKLCGAGAGGLMMFLAPLDTHDAFKEYFGAKNVFSIELVAQGSSLFRFEMGS